MPIETMLGILWSQGDRFMKRLLWMLPVLLLACVVAKAQETPSWELSGGYSHLYANVGNGSFNMNGGGGSVQQNVNNWFGGRLEINTWGGDTGGVHVTAQTYTFGPVFAYRKYQRFTPFAHANLGAIHASAGYLGISESATKFVLVPGGGVDIGLNPRLAVRLQGDYLASYYLNSRQDNLQFSVGLVFRIGEK
jgi:hypothetical protein